MTVTETVSAPETAETAATAPVLTVPDGESIINPEVTFDVADADRLEPEHIYRLAAGLVAAVRVREFFTPAQCAQIMAALEGSVQGTYGSQGAPKILKIGPSAYDIFSLHEDAYWPEAARASKLRSRLLGGDDPFAVAIRKVADMWGGPVRPARRGDRDMFAGLIREINQGAIMHFDEIVCEMPGVIEELPVAQLAFNVHLSVPEHGGETRVFRKRWRPDDERFKDGYGYVPEVVGDEPQAQVRGDVGDAVLFDSRNYHMVETTQGNGRRVALAFFLGLTGAGELVTWS